MSDFNRGNFISYVRPDEYRTCDECGITHRTSELERLLLHGKQHDRCRDRGRCAQWKAELAKRGPR